MNSANFMFYAELSDFLPSAKRARILTLLFQATPSVKHLIESSGIPHTEVGCVLVNDAPVNFSYPVQLHDRVEVYPYTPSQAATEPNLLPPLLPGEPRFILDNHLGRLAAYLRMLGLDCLYRNDFQDEELAEIAGREQRILLTRDRRLLMRRCVTFGCCLHTLEPKTQLIEILQRYQLSGRVTPFERCLRCNHPLEQVSKTVVLDRLEPLTRLYYDDFHQCPACNQIYWKGSHYERMEALIAQLGV